MLPNATHTSGPWQVVQDWEEEAPEAAYVRCPDGTEFCMADSGGYDIAYMRIEDARLIAAAPDLLAALEAVQQELIRVDAPIRAKVYLNLLEAIAKARGV